jgi:NADH-quinone oxidoreductase subunit H
MDHAGIGYWITIALLGFVVTPVLGALVKWVDRLVTARIQWRKGPPPFQVFADVLKLMGKETLVSEGACTPVFLLAPILGFIGVGVAAAMLWATALGGNAGFNGDLIVLIYFLVFPSLALILGASASGSPHAGVGAAREMKLVIAYELPLILAVSVAVLKAGGTFRLADIVAADPTGAASPALLGFASVLAVACALMTVQAKLGLVPFDQAEAETELMGGVIVDYSGPPLAFILLTRAMLLVVLPMFVITVLWGGFVLTGLGLLATIGKFLLIIVIIVLMRNTCPRVRIDQAVKWFWFAVTPVAALACYAAVLGK